jgi:hypothetical protein
VARAGYLQPTLGIATASCVFTVDLRVDACKLLESNAMLL